MITTRIKTSVGKKLGLNNIAPSPHCPPSGPSRGPLLGEALVLEASHSPHIVKCAKRKLLSTLPGASPSPLEVSEWLPPLYYTYPLSFFVIPGLPNSSSGFRSSH